MRTHTHIYIYIMFQDNRDIKNLIIWGFFDLTSQHIGITEKAGTSWTVSVSVNVIYVETYAYARILTYVQSGSWSESVSVACVSPLYLYLDRESSCG